MLRMTLDTNLWMKLQRIMVSKSLGGLGLLILGMRVMKVIFKGCSVMLLLRMSKTN